MAITLFRAAALLNVTGPGHHYCYIRLYTDSRYSATSLDLHQNWLGRVSRKVKIQAFPGTGRQRVLTFDLAGALT
jgi:hypothetical protein